MIVRKQKCVNGVSDSTEHVANITALPLRKMMLGVLVNDTVAGLLFH